MRPLTRCLIAGSLMGAAHLNPAIEPAAFGGLALLIGTVARVQRPPMAAVGWLLAAAITHAEFMLSVSFEGALGLAAAGWLFGGVLAGAPGAIALLFLGSRVRPFLVLLWLGGEYFCEYATQFPGGHLIYGQWSNPLVLRSLSMMGWWPTILGCALVAEVLLVVWMWRPYMAVLMFFAGFLGGEMSSGTARSPLEMAQQLGAWPMTTFVGADSSWPMGIDLIIWPEVTERDAIQGEEGPLVPPARTSIGETGVTHIRGGLLNTKLGTMNTAFLVDEHGAASYAHGKRWLAPVGEAPLLGWSPMKAAFIPGNTAPIMSANGRVVLVAICFESYVRALFDDGLRSKPSLVAAMASDRPLGGSHIAVMQQVGVLALRAAEYRIPVVRASKGGQSAIIDELGHVSLVETHAGELTRNP